MFYSINRFIKKWREGKNRQSQFLFIVLCAVCAPSFCYAAEIQIAYSKKASSPEKIAAQELAYYLSKLYPGDTFEVEAGLSDDAAYQISLGTPESAPGMVRILGQDKIVNPESFVVMTEGKQKAFILGADRAGVMYGVYGLLEKLGCGFFLSNDTTPLPKAKPFDLSDWNLSNHPLAAERIVFNWHNFLTGCTAWNLEDWKLWVRQSQKSGYNTVMVHAYGNNPMFTFEFNGVEKPVGYLASTAHGRDWGVTHINDVRRGAGGFLFEDAVFGSDAAKVPYQQRVEAKQKMMQAVFGYAQERGVKINFALDMDTSSANPQAIINRLDSEDRFKIGRLWAARPDTLGGYAYYKAQAEALLALYPEIDTLTLWRRKGSGFGSVWPQLKEEEMPDSWKEEYQAMVVKDPKLKDVHLSCFNFAFVKVFNAWRKALDELGRTDIEIATGSWQFEWLEGAVPFLPGDVKLLPLDYKCMKRDGGEYSNPEMLDRLAQDIEPGRLIPIIWAHHDDGAYIGAPLPYLKSFNDKLEATGAAGFGVIHWMTHPLDPYFTSHIRQTWANTENETAKATNAFIASRWFGAKSVGKMATYLDEWIKSMPTVARATNGIFIDWVFTRYRGVKTIHVNQKKRLALLESVDVDAMTEGQRKQWQFFRDYEDFVLALYKTQTPYDKAKKALEKGHLKEARKHIEMAKPEHVTETFARLIQARGTSPGEEGIVVSMNTRWIPWHIEMRQRVGLEAVRFNYASTSHENLAQAVGGSTHYIDSKGKWWLALGEHETTHELFTTSSIPFGDYGEICHTGILSDAPIRIPLTTTPLVIKDKNKEGGEPLPTGHYKLTLLFIEPSATAVGERVMRVEIDGKKVGQVDVFNKVGGRNQVLSVDYSLEIREGQVPIVELKPLQGQALLCGLVVTPVD